MAQRRPLRSVPCSSSLDHSLPLERSLGFVPATGTQGCEQSTTGRGARQHPSFPPLALSLSLSANLCPSVSLRAQLQPLKPVHCRVAGAKYSAPRNPDIMFAPISAVHHSAAGPNQSKCIEAVHYYERFVCLCINELSGSPAAGLCTAARYRPNFRSTERIL